MVESRSFIWFSNSFCFSESSFFLALIVVRSASAIMLSTDLSAPPPQEYRTRARRGMEVNFFIMFVLFRVDNVEVNGLLVPKFSFKDMANFHLVWFQVPFFY